jgi:hypothetical protein
MFIDGSSFALTVTFSDQSTAVGNVAINALPVVTVTASTPSAVEGGAAGAFTVSRTGSTAAALTVNYTVGGTATSGSDYQTIGTSVVIAASSATAVIPVTTINDSGLEGDETVVITLSANASYSVGSPSSATVTIADDDVPTVTIVATDANAAEAGLDGGVFTVTRTGSTATALTVNYTVGGTASNGVDYQTIPTSVVIPTSASTATITVTPIDDSVNEGDETVVMTLSASASYSVGSPGTATVTIADNDAPVPPAITLSYDGRIRDRVGAGQFVPNPDGQMDATFTVTLNAGSGNRTVTQLSMLRNGGDGTWNTFADLNWILGAANGLDTALLNGANDTVNFPVAGGSSFKVFASDWQNRMFIDGSSFALTVTFSDQSTAVGSVILP